MCVTNKKFPVGDKQMSSSPQQMGSLEFISLLLLSFIFLLPSLIDKVISIGVAV